MTGSIRLRRDDKNVDDDDDGSGNICDSTFFYDSSNKRTKRADRLDMPLENLPVTPFAVKISVPENPLFIGRHLAYKRCVFPIKKSLYNID